MVFEAAAIVAVMIFGILAAHVSRAMIQLQKTLVETQDVLAILRREGTPLIHEMRTAVNEAQSLTLEARRAGDRLGVFFDSIQDVGQQFSQVQGLVRRAGEAWHVGGRSVLSSLSAVAIIVGRKLQHNHGGRHNGR